MVAFRNTVIAATFAVCVAAQQQADGQITASTSVAPATQIDDGQIQVTTSAAPVPVSQISDGQIQVTTSAAPVPVSQISDGQIQVTTAAPVVPVSQISDGQIQAPTGISSGAPMPSPNGTTIAPVAPTPSAFTGAANIMAWSKEIAVVAVGAVAGLVML